jgi:hypothetical protein
MSDQKEKYVTADTEKHAISGAPDEAGDVALGVFEEVRGGVGAIDVGDDKDLLWKIDIRLMHLL